MIIYSHEYAVYAYDTGKCAHGRGLSCRIWVFYIHKYWASRYYKGHEVVRRRVPDVAIRE